MDVGQLNWLRTHFWEKLDKKVEFMKVAGAGDYRIYQVRPVR